MIYMIGFLMALLLLNMPVAFALVTSATAYVFLQGKFPLTLIPQQMFIGTDKFVFLAVPFFILSGLLMQKGGISERLIRLSSVLLDKVTGGFAMATAFASMIFASISGSGPATTAAIGGAMLPALVEKGYGREWSVAYIATAGTIGPVIPPSITMVIYGALASTSIGALFIAGFLPGILMGLGLMAMAYFRAKKMYVKAESKKTEWHEVFEAFKRAIWALIMPLIIIGGILGGIFTPTEAAVVSVVYALVIILFVYRSLTLRDLPSIFKQAVITSAVVMMLCACASAFSWIIGAEQGPQKLVSVFQSFSSNKYVLLLLVNLFLLLVGCFIDTTSAIVMTGPALVALAGSIGVSTLHLGLIMTVNLCIGMATPSLGFTLFTACSIGNVSIAKVTRPILPMIGILIITVLLVTYFPAIFLWIPGLFFK